jgi:cytochrome c-type biogenesis protein CcmH/NrfG
LTKAVSLLPVNYRVWFDLGRALRKLKDRDGALAALSWAAHLEPADPSVRSELAWVRAELPARTTDPSLGEFQKPALGDDSDIAASHLQFAIRLNDAGDYQGGPGRVAALAFAGAFES